MDYIYVYEVTFFFQYKIFEGLKSQNFTFFLLKIISENNFYDKIEH